jgi:glycosyltransferase involved in cell wall biosynthesis
MRILLVSEFFPSDFVRDVFGVHQRLRMLVDGAAEVGELDALFYVPATIDDTSLTRVRWQRDLSELWKVDVHLTLCPALDDAFSLPKAKIPTLLARSVRHGAFSFFPQKLSVRTSGNAQVRGLERALDRRPDLIVAHRLGAMAPLLRTKRPLPPIVFDLDDVEHVKYRRMVDGMAGLGPRVRYAITAPLLRRAESKAVRKAATTLVCSDVDRTETLRLAPDAHIVAVANGIRIPAAASPGSEPSVLFLGNFGYPPNADGATRLATEIWPRIRSAVPEAKLLLAGDHADRLPQAVRNADGVEVLGFVEDLVGLYARAQVVACPLRVGSGVRIKILEAAAWGKPVVATYVAAEGIPLTSDREFLLEDDPALFAEHCVRLLRDPVRRKLLGDQARAAMKRLYDRDRVVLEIGEHLRSAAASETDSPSPGRPTQRPSRGKRIVFVGGTTEPGGLHVHTAAVAAALDASGVGVTILSTETDFFTQLLEGSNVVVQRVALPAKGVRGFFAWRRVLRPFAGAQGVYCRDFGGTGSIALLLALWSRFASLYTIEHSLPAYDALLRGRATWRDQLANRLVHRALAVSEQVRQCLVDAFEFPADRIHTCFNWVDTEHFTPNEAERRRMRAEHGIDDDCFVVGYAGRLGAEKRIDLLIRGFARFVQGAKNAKLVIVGGGWLEADLRALAETHGLGDRILFAGWADDAAMWYRAFDLFVLTSLYEGFPLTLLEAMACETPCLSHHAGGELGGPAQCIHAGDNGFLALLDEADVIARWLLRISSLPPEERARLGVEARRTAVDEFGRARRLGDLLEQLGADDAAARVRSGAVASAFRRFAFRSTGA